MWKKFLGKFLIYFFVIAFCLILLVGIYRIHKTKIVTATEPISPQTPNQGTTASSILSNKKIQNKRSSFNTAKTQITQTKQTQINTKQTSSLSSKKSTPVPSTSRVVTGPTYQIPWGNVTVQITVRDGKIIAVRTPNVPNSSPSRYAAPILVQQALQAGSANIQGVSGATYMSIGFKKSLEGAIAQAGL